MKEISLIQGLKAGLGIQVLSSINLAKISKSLSVSTCNGQLPSRIDFITTASFNISKKGICSVRISCNIMLNDKNNLIKQ